MSNLLEQASLVMIPSGYKEDIVYSVIPTSGAGDLTFTRASNGTRIDSNGNVEVVPWNLCDYSEDQTQWTSQNETTVTANSTTAPNGTTTADTITPSTVNDDHYRGIVLGQQVGALTAFIYVKPNGYNFFDWGIWNSSQYIVRATFDLVNLTYTFTNAGTATIESVGNGWLKCGISGTNASLTTMSLYYRSRPTGGTGAFAGNGTSGAFVWGAQLNIGSTAKPYFPTTDRLNVPRLTYQNGGGGCPSLLLEKQSTNLVVQSNDMTTWTNGAGTMTKNATTSPDGTNNALSFDNTADCSTFVSASNGVYSWSLYIKQGTSATAAIDMSDGSTGDAYANFTFSSKTFSTTSSGSWSNLSTSYIECGNGWFRITLTATKNAGSSIGHKIIASGSGYTYVYGAQLEASSYPTSYIPTTSSSATRVADACYKTGISSLIGQSQGTMFADVNFFQTGSQYDTPIILTASGGVGSGYVVIDRYPDKTIVCEYNNGGSVAKIISSTTYNEGRLKIAFGYKQNDFVAYVNGVQIGTDTSGNTALTLTDLYMPYTPNDSSVGINEAILFPTRLTNSELAQLTGNQNYTINQAYESYGVASESPNCVQP